MQKSCKKENMLKYFIIMILNSCVIINRYPGLVYEKISLLLRDFFANAIMQFDEPNCARAGILMGISPVNGKGTPAAEIYTACHNNGPKKRMAA
jgi:hypothetical protein